VTPDENPPAVTFGGEGIAFPVVRSLDRAGVRAYAVGGDPEYNPIAYSRHCAGYTDLGSKEGVVDRWLDWLAGEAPRGAVLMPCNDDSLDLIVRHRATLEELGYVPVEADDEVLAAMLDKERTYELARAAGVPTPRTWTIGSGSDLDESIEEIGYPCALKPLHTHLFARVFGVGFKLLVANDRRELEEGLSRMTALGLEMAVTEIIPGPETELLSYCGYLDERGEPLTHFTFHKLRQYPPHFGLGCYVVSDWNQEAIDAGLHFLRGVGLRGLFHVEFKRDPRDGQLKLLECNHRFTIETMFAATDLPLLTYNRLLGRPLPPARPYKSGVHLWSPVPDVRAFLAYRRRGELTFGRWLLSLMHRQRFHAFRWDDPLPTIRHHLTLVGRVIRRLLFGRRQVREEDPLLASGR